MVGVWFSKKTVNCGVGNNIGTKIDCKTGNLKKKYELDIW